MLDLIIVLKTLNQCHSKAIQQKYAKPKLYMQQIREFHARVQHALILLCTPEYFVFDFGFSFFFLLRLRCAFAYCCCCCCCSFVIQIGSFIFVVVIFYSVLRAQLIERVQTFNNEIECNQAKDIENMPHRQTQQSEFDSNHSSLETRPDAKSKRQSSFWIIHGDIQICKVP